MGQRERKKEKKREGKKSSGFENSNIRTKIYLRKEVKVIVKKLYHFDMTKIVTFKNTCRQWERLKEICRFQWLDLLIKHGYFTITF